VREDERADDEREHENFAQKVFLFVERFVLQLNLKIESHRKGSKNEPNRRCFALLTREGVKT
jgi:hypothetical protein